MRDVRTAFSGWSVDLPVYDGTRPVEEMLSDPASWPIYKELFRNLIRDRSHLVESMTHWIPIELVYETLIIREFMQRRGLVDIRNAIGEFRIYQRLELRRSGFRHPSRSCTVMQGVN